MGVEGLAISFSLGCDSASHVLHERVEVVANEKPRPERRSMGGVDPSVELHSFGLRIGEGGVAHELAVAPRNRALQPARLLIQKLFFTVRAADANRTSSSRGVSFSTA